jgi:hypothetical protein
MQEICRTWICVVAVCVASTNLSPAHAEPEDLLSVLLRPAGWRGEWAGPGGTGLTEVIFEKRGDGVVAQIKLIVPFELTCEKPVLIEKNSVTFDGCRDPSVTLVYDPSDMAYPLKGRTPRGYEWKVKAK